MPENLKVVWRHFARESYETSLSGELRRHPILHGRELAYGTRVNSTKAFAFLRAVIESLQAQVAGRRDPGTTTT